LLWGPSLDQEPPEGEAGDSCRHPEQAVRESSRCDVPGVHAFDEAALGDAKGRVSGPSGAAAKLGIPGSTLESKIKVLGIRKDRFKGS